MQEWLTPTGAAAIASAATVMITKLIGVKGQAKKLNTDAATKLVNTASEFSEMLADKVENLEKQVSELIDRERERDVLLEEHREWDVQIREVVRELGGEITKPPPLFMRRK